MENSDPDSFRLNIILEYPLVLTVLIISCIPLLILTANELGSISSWFMPEFSAELLTPHSIWRLWTPTFVHYTLPHIIPNLILWWIFGSKIEKQSTLELAVLLIIIAACSNFAQWWFEGPRFGGLSGVAYGLMGYLWVLHRFGGKVSYRFDPIIAVIMLLIIPLSFTGYLGKLSDYAHITGLLCGLLLAFASVLLQACKNKTIAARS